ncbi:phage holin family protein (plasmid) [Ensifer adhaerens]|nr:phage holin family protein [Ensifer adhaerens]MBZ7927539.1 phage holin family protein [Ensifer adhaerens]UAX98432.1 phage holin family protein [Ensifer adhaerens]UAY05813.1 phage holin family protein [Ensifer adhaerens]UAY13190.1 phage holin family protein [Ensifer adhaerens]
MLNPRDERSLPDLMTGLVTDISGLFRKEIDLAKAEAGENLDRAIGSLETLLVGLIFAIAAIGVLLSAVVVGLGAFLIAQGMHEANAHALSAIIVGAFVAILAWVMISRSLTKLGNRSVRFDKTTASLQRDLDVAKETVR